MSFCPNCGTRLDQGFSFCPNCGFNVASILSMGTGACTPSPSGQKDFVDKYLRLKPGIETFDSFNAKLEIKGDITAICSALDSDIKPAAQSGDASANVVLGVLYEKGFAIEESFDKALHCFMEAADKGHPVAEWIAGLLNMEADSFLALFADLDLSRGFQWFIRSANHGFCAAMVNLGNCCSEGKGTAQNKSEALNWYRKAAELGYAPAQHKLGCCYDFFDGFTHDYPEAVKWYSKAAAQGYSSSQNNIGVCFRNGNGVPKDCSEAAKWFRKSAEQGVAVAQRNLGECYENGEGVPADKAEALKWFRKAAENGDLTANSRIKKIENELAENEKNRADRANRGDDIVSVRFSWSEPYYYMGVEHSRRKSFVNDMTRSEYLALLSSGQYGIATYMKGRFGYDYDDPSIELLSFG